MSIFLIKSILALFFLAAGVISFLAMMLQMGTPEKKWNPVTLRKIHRFSGFTFIVLLLVISYLCVRFLVIVGDQLSAQAVFHGILSLLLIVIVFLKVIIIRSYKLFMKYVPGLGMTIFCLSFVLTASSAGYYFLRTGGAAPSSSRPAPLLPSADQGDAQRGASLFATKCSTCHLIDSESDKVGPGLKGILQRKQLPVSHRASTPENVVRQLKTPYLAMPAFPSLSDQDIADLLAYLKTLQ